MSSNSMPTNNQCEYCKQQFSTNYDLNRHIKLHLMDKDFQNSLYDYATNFQKCLEQTIHTIDLPSNHPEPHCSRTLVVSQPESEVVDLTTHSNIEEETVKKYKCSLCSYKTKSRGYINRHLRAHAGLKTYSCSSCDYQAEKKSVIRKHYREAHLTMLFKCPQPDCNYSGNKSSQLTAHMKMHSAERPFVCSFPNCNYTGYKKLQVSAHMRKHSTDRPFACSFPNCNFKTKVKPNLERHETAHQSTGDKLYGCSFCSYSSNNKMLVSGHIQSHHDAISDAGQSQSGSRAGKSRSDNSNSDDYTHVQWSVDWGRIVNHAVDGDKGQSSRIVIKMESDVL